MLEQSSSDEQQALIARRIRAASERVRLSVRRYRSSDFWLLLVSITTGALATILAGGSASVGAPAIEFFGGWRILCFAVAGITAFSTLAAGLHKGFHVSDRLSEGRTCLAKLQALELDLELDRRSPEKIVEEYQHLLTTYPGFITE